MNKIRTTIAEYLFYTIVLSIPFEHVLSVGGISVSKIIGFLFLPFSLMQRRIFYRQIPDVFIVLLGFVAVGLAMDVSYGRALEIDTLNEYMRPSLLWILMLACYNLARAGRAAQIMICIYCSVMVLTVFQTFNIGLHTRIYSLFLHGVSGDRIAVLGSDPNFLALLISLGILYNLTYSFNVGNLKLFPRLLFLLAAFLGFYSILKTGSRGGIIALLVSIPSLAITGRGFSKTARAGIAIAFILVLMGTIIINDPLMMARFQQSSDNPNVVLRYQFMEKLNTASRDRIWDEAINRISEAPIFGYGISAHTMELAKFASPQIGSVTAAHNTVLSVMLGTGIAGLFCFSYFLISSFKSIVSCRKQILGSIVLSWYILMLVGGLSLSLEGSKMFWLVAALSLAIKPHCDILSHDHANWSSPRFDRTPA